MTLARPQDHNMRRTQPGSISLLSPAHHPTQSDSELFLNYGPHSNCRLFVEYGFVNPGQADVAEVDVQDLVEPLFDKAGQDGLYKKQLLVDENYWGWAIPSHTQKDIDL